MEQKIKQNGIDIGGNIRRIRLEKGCGQTELVRMLQLKNIDITRETLVKIERGIQHITGSQLRGIRDCLDTTYDELLKQILLNFSFSQNYSSFSISLIRLFCIKKEPRFSSTTFPMSFSFINIIDIISL